MIDKKLKGELKKVTVPDFDKKKIQDTIEKAKIVKMYPERQRMSNMEFYFNQLSFINKKTWLLKICFTFLILCLIMFDNIGFHNWIFTLLAVSGPILCLINANEICNIFQPGMIEIQMTARHSFIKVLIIRLMAFGVLDFVFFIFAANMISFFKETIIWQAIIYGTVPYEIMCFGCMTILNRCREENILLYSSTWGASIICIVFTLKISGIEIFKMHCFHVWMILGLVTFVGVVLELKKFLKKAEGNLNEINYGSFI